MTALQLADYLDGLYCSTDFNLDKGFLAAAELRRLAELERDAARYRWLRDSSANQFQHPIVVSQEISEYGMRYVGPLISKNLDAAIDAAMGEAK